MLMYSILLIWKLLDANSYAVAILLRLMVGTLNLSVSIYSYSLKVGRRKWFGIICVFFFFPQILKPVGFRQELWFTFNIAST